jgi:hypothetical protein
MQKNTVFWTLFIEKSISTQVKFKSSLKFLQTLVLNKQKLLRSLFYKFRIQAQNMIFSRSRENFQIKCALIILKVGSSESQQNTQEKVGLLQVDILKFQWSNFNKHYFFT